MLRECMVLLNNYEDKNEAESYLAKIRGDKRLASERDDSSTVYNLFGNPTWSNFYQLDMYCLKELEGILYSRDKCQSYDLERHKEIIDYLEYIAKCYSLTVPHHWK